MEKNFFVYMVTNKKDGVLYTGVSSSLLQRTSKHKEKTYRGFSAKYNLDKLVWYEQCPTAEAAIMREKQIKKWNRAWKIELIEKTNSAWRDLYADAA
jgi:putative endonuclease